MNRSRKHLTVATIAAAAVSLSALPAVAHIGVGTGGGGFEVGFAHPFTGIDHLVASVGVGVLSALRGGGAMLTIPAAFVGAMVLGALLPILGATIPAGEAEIMIVLSLLAVGTLLGMGRRLTLPVVVGAVAVFALFHGIVHGNEMAASVGPIPYILGLVSSTVVLLALGYVAAVTVTRLLNLGHTVGSARS